MIAKITIAPELSPSMGNRVDALNAKIDAHHAKQAELDESVTTMAILRPLRMLDSLNAKRLDMLGEEIALRRQSVTANEDCITLLSDQIIGNAHKAHEGAKAAITAALVKLGYRPFVDGVVDPCAIEQGMILRHPTVHEARNRLAELQAKPEEHRQAIQQNSAAISGIEAKLKRIRASKIAAFA
jgi:hypothetical protein